MEPQRDDDFYPFGLSGRRTTILPMDYPHRHYEIELFSMDGPFTRTLGGKEMEIPANTALLFWGAVPHQLLKVNDGASGFVGYIPIHQFLKWELPQEILSVILRGDPFPIPLNGQIRESFKELEKWLPSCGFLAIESYRYLLIQGHFCRMLDLAWRDYKQDSETKPTNVNEETRIDQIAALIRYMIEHVEEPLKTAEIAKAVSLHPNYAGTIFKEATGATLLQFLTQYRIDLAKSKLSRTDSPILDVALDSGFGSISHFHEIFRKSEGLTPRQFRIQQQNPTGIGLK